MPNSFKRYRSNSIGTSPTTVYTVPALTTAVLIGLNLANRTAAQIKVTVTHGASTNLLKDVPIPAGAFLSALDGKIIAEAGDTIIVTSDTAASVDVVLSCLEQS